ncbi:hypothetical protein DV515_00010623 [Chloebia gouldiae]|uniref:Uncharacterized protein n=1 Tax=Chloebia gouldiae TaxID=44316 RepID=A0A3L8S8N1_CHLGU|nr:hypothetical protein DV515_00010623 [Chloebia gouldiae]
MKNIISHFDHVQVAKWIQTNRRIRKSSKKKMKQDEVVFQQKFDRCNGDFFNTITGKTRVSAASYILPSFAIEVYNESENPFLVRECL